MAAIYPAVASIRTNIAKNAKLKSIATKPFKELKTQLLALQSKYEKNPTATEAEQRSMIDASQNGTSTSEGPSDGGRLWSAVASALTFRPGALFSQNSKGPTVDDKDFLNGLTALSVKYPALTELVEQAFALATSHFLSHIEKEAVKTAKEIEEAQRKDCTKQLNMALEHQLTAIRDKSRSQFLQAVEDTFVKDVRK